MAVTVPMIGWVAKDTTSVGFPVSKFGAQRARDPGRPEAGDGSRPDGAPLAPGPPTTTSIAAPPEVIRRWIDTIRQKPSTRGARCADIYILFNEPGLCTTTNLDIRLEPSPSAH